MTKNEINGCLGFAVESFYVMDTACLVCMVLIFHNGIMLDFKLTMLTDEMRSLIHRLYQNLVCEFISLTVDIFFRLS